MRAIIKMELERPTRNGYRVTSHTIIAKEEEIVGAVDAWIADRMNKPEGWIRVKKFNVVIDNPITKIEWCHWSYTPTYEEED